MKTTDWNYDFSSLPHWDNRETLWGVYDEFYELPQSDTLCCLYSIFEVGMCRYVGFLAILRNKENPQLVLNSTINFNVHFSASEDGNLIFLQPQLWDRAANKGCCPVLILDLENKRFSYLRTDNRCPGYKVTQKKKNLFVIEADERQRKHNKKLKALHGKKIRTNWLKWHSIEKLDLLENLVFRG